MLSFPAPPHGELPAFTLPHPQDAPTVITWNQLLPSPQALLVLVRSQQAVETHPDDFPVGEWNPSSQCLGHCP